MGLLHLPVFLAYGDSWEGPISWRKPILFGVSTGMTLWSLGWIVSYLKRNTLDKCFAAVVSVTLVVEVLLITWQQWRGQPSHFNRVASFDAAIDYSMLVLITVAFLGICYFAIRCCGRLDLAADYRVAARLGMFFLVLSCIIGFVISTHGYHRIEQGLNPETVGNNGVAKFPHGIAIHALQLLPALVFVMRKLSVSLELRLLMLWATVISTAFLLAFAIVQTLQGHSRFDLQTISGTAVFTLGIISFVAPLLFTVVKISRCSRRQDV